MDILVAIGHIAGSILAVVGLGIVTAIIGMWEAQRYERQALNDAAIALGVSVEDLDKEEVVPRVIQFSAERYSDELLRNRLSDFCGFLRTIWSWLGSIIQIAILVGVVWYTFTDSLKIAIYAWWIVAVEVGFWLPSILFSFLCKLLTGRYPGQAKQARKSLAQFVRNQ